MESLVTGLLGSPIYHKITTFGRYDETVPERRSIGIHSHRNFFHGITCSRIHSGGTILRHWAMIK
ncbi:hypothetical protein D4758_03600 [Enterocloster citroniae]|nr:hypothetical protein [Enterocloster citroniae]